MRTLQHITKFHKYVSDHTTNEIEKKKKKIQIIICASKYANQIVTKRRKQ